MKISKNARKDKDGKKPSVLYVGAQHAREWITPEMNRRLMHYLIDNYASDPKIKRLVDKNELWFVPVVEPGRLRLHLRARPAAVAQEPARQQQRRRDRAR